MPSVPGSQEQDRYNLAFHREFVRHIGAVLAGQEALSHDQGIVHVYRTPPLDVIVRMPSMTQTNYGQLTWNQSGHVLAVLPSGEQAYVDNVTADPHQASAFINSMVHLVQTRRRELEVLVNEDLERSRRRERSVPGAAGHMLELYDHLLDQITHEHFQQKEIRDRAPRAV